jgi:hypothetical protein
MEAPSQATDTGLTTNEWEGIFSEGVFMGTPPAWSPAMEVDNGLVVEAGRRGPDILFHLWHSDFPKDFADQLADAVELVAKATERFEADYTPDMGAVWNPHKNELVPGPIEFIRQITLRGHQRVVTSWALRCKGYAPVEAAHEMLTRDLVGAISEIFAS